MLRHTGLALVCLLIACGDSKPRPQLLSATPDRVTTLADTPVMLAGQNLHLALVVDLDDDKPPTLGRGWTVTVGAERLPASNVTWHNPTMLEIVVPKGLAPGEYPVVATSPGGAQVPLPDMITVEAGPVGLTVSVETAADGNGAPVPAQTLTAGDDLAAFAIARQPDGTFVANVAASWSVTGGIGVVGGGESSSTTFGARLVGVGSITATASGAAPATSAALTVIAGPAAAIEVRDAPGSAGNAIGDVTGLTTDDTLVAHAVGVDAYGNFVGDVAVTWSVTGGIGTADPGPASMTTVDFAIPGTGTLVATDPVAGTDSTGNLTVSAGQAVSLAVVPPTLLTNADASPTLFTATGKDLDGNNTADLGVLTWDVSSGPITSMATDGTFTPTAAGSGNVRVTSSYLISAVSGNVTVDAGRVATLTVAPDQPVGVTTDTLAFAFAATGVDADGNPTSDLGVITWSNAVVGTIGTGTGIFDPDTPGTGTVRATSSYGPFDDTSSFDVLPGRAATLTVAPDSLTTVQNGATTAFSVTGTDADGNPTSDLGVITWSIPTPPMASIDGVSGVLTPTVPGSDVVRATSSYGPFDDTSTVTVLREATLVSTWNAVPATASETQSFVITMRVTNTGESDAMGVTPSALSQNGTTIATLISGPTPASATITAGGSVDFSWTYSAASAGTVNFNGNASGTDTNTLNVVSSAAVGTADITVQTPAALTATITIPAADIEGKMLFSVDLEVTNSGQADATGVTPSITLISGTGSVLLVVTPPAATVPGGGSMTFSYTYQATGVGTIQFTGQGDGNDANTGAPITTGSAMSAVGNIVNTAPTPPRVAGGSAHTCARLRDGSVWCSGDNSKGQLGDNTTGGSDSPVQVHGVGNAGILTDIIDVAAGDKHSCAATGSGDVLCWGDNPKGQLGDGTTDGKQVPVKTLGLVGVTSVVAGQQFTCARQDDNSVWCWGDNSARQLGQGTDSGDKNAPVRVLGPGGVGFLTGIGDIAAGRDWACGIKTGDGSGSVWCWGKNDKGQLGNGAPTGQVATPVQVTGLTNVVHLDAGDTHTCAVRSDGTVWCWGKNDKGQLGDNSTDDSAVPVQVRGPGGVGFFAGAGSAGCYVAFSCAAKTDGSVWCWGEDIKGQLGDGPPLADSLTPVQVAGAAGPPTTLASGKNMSEGSGVDVHACVGRTDGTVFCWGKGGNGELGDGNRTDSDIPVQFY